MSQRASPDVPLLTCQIKWLLPLLLVTAALSACQRSIAGVWAGAVDNGASPRLVLHVTVDPAGKLALSFDDLDSGIRNVPGDKVVLIGNHFSFDIHEYAAGVAGRSNYKGTLSPDGKTVSGIWEWCLVPTSEVPAVWPIYAAASASVERVSLRFVGPFAGGLQPILAQEPEDDFGLDGGHRQEQYPIAFHPDLRSTACLQVIAGWLVPVRHHCLSSSKTKGCKEPNLLKWTGIGPECWTLNSGPPWHTRGADYSASLCI